MAQLEINRFRAQHKDGRIVTVIERQEQVPFRNLNGQITYHRGTTTLTLDGGGYVSQIDSETFKIIDTDEIIRKIG